MAAVECLSDCSLPTEFGSSCTLRVYGQYGGGPSSPQWIACAWGDTHGREALPVRVHDACLTSEIFGSLKCDCAKQLRLAQQALAKHGGLLIYTPQEGRGIGLAQKVAAYALQETRGLDTVDANIALGEPAEARDYAPVRSILDHLGVQSIVLLTNNPFKVNALRDLGVRVLSRRAVVADVVPTQCAGYLRAKAERMGHLLHDVGGDAGGQERFAPSDDDSQRCGQCVEDDEKEEAAAAMTTTTAAAATATAAAAAAAAAAPQPPWEAALDRLRDHSGRHLTNAASATPAAARRHARASPFVTLTYAQALDGSIAGPRGAHGPRLILSGEKSMAFTHALRAAHDAILVGVGTLLADDPQLTVRLVQGASPMRVVLDSHLRAPPHARAFAPGAHAAAPTDGSAAPVRPHAVVAALASVLHNDPGAAERAACLRRRGVLVVGVPADADGHACLPSTLELLRNHLGVRSVMIEGGASVIGSCTRAKAAHHVIITLAPKMLVNGLRPGGGAAALGAGAGTESTAVAGAPAVAAPAAAPTPGSALEQVHTFSLGDDVVVCGLGPAAAAASASARGGARAEPAAAPAQQHAGGEMRLASRL